MPTAVPRGWRRPKPTPEPSVDATAQAAAKEVHPAAAPTAPVTTAASVASVAVAATPPRRGREGSEQPSTHPISRQSSVSSTTSSPTAVLTAAAEATHIEQLNEAQEYGAGAYNVITRPKDHIFGTSNPAAGAQEQQHQRVTTSMTQEATMPCCFWCRRVNIPVGLRQFAEMGRAAIESSGTQSGTIAGNPKGGEMTRQWHPLCTNCEEVHYDEADALRREMKLIRPEARVARKADAGDCKSSSSTSGSRRSNLDADFRGSVESNNTIANLVAATIGGNDSVLVDDVVNEGKLIKAADGANRDEEDGELAAAVDTLLGISRQGANRNPIGGAGGSADGPVPNDAEMNPSGDQNPEDHGATRSGRWTQEEHMTFLEALRVHGQNWEKIAAMVPTRTVIQMRTHCQRWALKQNKTLVAQDKVHDVVPNDEKDDESPNNGNETVSRPAISSKDQSLRTSNYCLTIASKGNGNAAEYAYGVEKAQKGADQKDAHEMPIADIQNNDVVDPDGNADTEKGADEETFPVALMRIVSDPSIDAVVKWLPTGKKFIILEPKTFVSDVMPRIFGPSWAPASADISVFAQKAEAYGFHRVQMKDKHAKYIVLGHPRFLRGETELCKSIEILKTSLQGKSDGGKSANTNDKVLVGTGVVATIMTPEEKAGPTKTASAEPRAAFVVEQEPTGIPSMSAHFNSKTGAGVVAAAVTPEEKSKRQSNATTQESLVAPGVSGAASVAAATPDAIGQSVRSFGSSCTMPATSTGNTDAADAGSDSDTPLQQERMDYAQIIERMREMTISLPESQPVARNNAGDIGDPLDTSRAVVLLNEAVDKAEPEDLGDGMNIKSKGGASDHSTSHEKGKGNLAAEKIGEALGRSSTELVDLVNGYAHHHLNLQHPHSRKGWKLIRNVALPRSDPHNPKSGFRLNIQKHDHKSTRPYAVVANYNPPEEVSKKLDGQNIPEELDVIVAVNGQLVFDVNTMNIRDNFTFRPVVKLMRLTEENMPLRLDLLRFFAGNDSVDEGPVAGASAATIAESGSNASTSSTGTVDSWSLAATNEWQIGTKKIHLRTEGEDIAVNAGAVAPMSPKDKSRSVNTTRTVGETSNANNTGIAQEEPVVAMLDLSARLFDDSRTSSKATTSNGNTDAANDGGVGVNPLQQKDGHLDPHQTAAVAAEVIGALITQTIANTRTDGEAACFHRLAAAGSAIENVAGGFEIHRETPAFAVKRAAEEAQHLEVVRLAAEKAEQEQVAATKAPRRAEIACLQRAQKQLIARENIRQRAQKDAVETNLQVLVEEMAEEKAAEADVGDDIIPKQKEALNEDDPIARRHLNLQHPPPAKGWKLIRNVALPRSDPHNPKSSFCLALGAQNPGAGTCSFVSEYNLPKGMVQNDRRNPEELDIIVAVNGQIVFNANTLKICDDFNFHPVVNLVRRTEENKPLRLDLLRHCDDKGGADKGLVVDVSVAATIAESGSNACTSSTRSESVSDEQLVRSVLAQYTKMHEKLAVNAGAATAVSPKEKSMSNNITLAARGTTDAQGSSIIADVLTNAIDPSVCFIENSRTTSTPVAFTSNGSSIACTTSESHIISHSNGEGKHNFPPKKNPTEGKANGTRTGRWNLLPGSAGQEPPNFFLSSSAPDPRDSYMSAGGFRDQVPPLGKGGCGIILPTGLGILQGSQVAAARMPLSHPGLTPEPRQQMQQDMLDWERQANSLAAAGAVESSGALQTAALVEEIIDTVPSVEEAREFYDTLAKNGTASLVGGRASSLTGQAWKKISPEEKARYEKLVTREANEAKAKDVSQSGEAKKASGKKTAYILFQRAYSIELRAAGVVPNSKLLGTSWKSLSAEKKQEYETKAIEMNKTAVNVLAFKTVGVAVSIATQIAETQSLLAGIICGDESTDATTTVGVAGEISQNDRLLRLVKVGLLQNDILYSRFGPYYQNLHHQPVDEESANTVETVCLLPAKYRSHTGAVKIVETAKRFEEECQRLCHLDTICGPNADATGGNADAIGGNVDGCKSSARDLLQTLLSVVGAEYDHLLKDIAVISAILVALSAEHSDSFDSDEIYNVQEQLGRLKAALEISQAQGGEKGCELDKAGEDDIRVARSPAKNASTGTDTGKGQRAATKKKKETNRANTAKGSIVKVRLFSGRTTRLLLTDSGPLTAALNWPDRSDAKVVSSGKENHDVKTIKVSIANKASLVSNTPRPLLATIPRKEWNSSSRSTAVDTEPMLDIELLGGKLTRTQKRQLEALMSGKDDGSVGPTTGRGDTKRRKITAGSGITMSEQQRSFASPKKMKIAKKASKPLVRHHIRSAPEIGPGWTTVGIRRAVGETEGHIDKYWYSPRLNKIFRSMKEVQRFLSVLDSRANGDEEAAYSMIFASI